MPGLVIKDVMHIDERVSLLVEDGEVTIVADAPSGVEVIDGRGLEAVPAFWDGHVHFREPGNSEAEDILSGARAAAAGGYGVVCCEPNTRPVTDTLEAVQAFDRRVDELQIPINVYQKVALTKGQEGSELVDIELIGPDVIAFSTDGEPLVNRELLVEAFRRTFSCTEEPREIHAHCEETPRSHERVVAALGEGPYLARETDIVRLHLEALEQAGMGFLRIQHVSLPETVELVEEFMSHILGGENLYPIVVTMEVAPHHLWFCQDDIPQVDGRPDANWKMNPPLRSAAARAGLWKHLDDFRWIATDHAPHAPASKRRAWDDAPFGVIGLETAFGAMASFDDIDDRRPVQQMLIDRMAPYNRLVSPLSQRFSCGITLVDWERQWTVDPETFYSKSRNCPFAGMTLTGKPVYTIVNGRIVMAEGEVLF